MALIKSFSPRQEIEHYFPFRRRQGMPLNGKGDGSVEPLKRASDVKQCYILLANGIQTQSCWINSGLTE